MAIKKSRLGNLTFDDGENSITLRASLSNLRELEAAVGMPWFEYIAEGHCKNPDEFTKLFYHLQEPAGEGIYTEDEIYDAFFCDLTQMADDVWMNKLKDVFQRILDPNLQLKLNAVAPSDKKKDQ